jgi:phosphate transport system permease protein
MNQPAASQPTLSQPAVSQSALSRLAGRARKLHRSDRWIQTIFASCAVIVSAVIVSIVTFVGFTGVQTFGEVAPFELLFSTDWSPAEGKFGIMAFWLGTIVLSGLALALAVPIGVAGAVFMAKIAPGWMREILRPATDLFVGIPSVVYGFLGLTVLVPLLRQLTGGIGYGILPAAIVLAVMIFPTILSISEDTLRALPKPWEEASYALGATRWQTIRRTLLPAARSGMATGAVLGLGRAIGETMAVLMVIGNAPQLPKSLLDPATVLTTAIVKDMPFTSYGSTWNHVLYLMALLLLLVSLGMIIAIRAAAGAKAK